MKLTQKSAAKGRPAKLSARRVAAAYAKVSFGSRKAVARSLAKVRVASLDVGALLDTARSESMAKVTKLAIGLVGKRKHVGEERDTIRGMIRWAAVQTNDADARRRSVMRAFRANGRDVFAIHGISELPAAEAELFKVFKTWK